MNAAVGICDIAQTHEETVGPACRPRESWAPPPEDLLMKTPAITKSYPSLSAMQMKQLVANDIEAARSVLTVLLGIVFGGTLGAVISVTIICMGWL